MIVIRFIMVWTEEKDVKLLRAVAAEGVFINSRARSREKGELWQVAASSLLAERMPVTFHLGLIYISIECNVII